MSESNQLFARYETIRSVPPYRRGGTLSMRGAICAIFNFLPWLGRSVLVGIDHLSFTWHLSSSGRIVLRSLHDFIGVARQPFFVVGERSVGLFQASKLKGFGGRMRIVEQLSVFGRFCAVAICGEHVK